MYIEKIQKGWTELDSEIIKTGKCTYCGACAAFCINIKYDQEIEIPIEDGSCKDSSTCRDGYGLCYNLCPKTETEHIPLSLLDKWVFGKKNNQILGHYIDILSVKLNEKVIGEFPPDVGPLTAILLTAMQNNKIDAAIISKKDEFYQPYPTIATNKEDLFEGAGYKPQQNPTISLIGDAINKDLHSKEKAADLYLKGTRRFIAGLEKLMPPRGYLKEEGNKGSEYLLDAYKKIYDSVLKFVST